MKRKGRMLAGLSVLTALVVGGFYGIQSFAYQTYSGVSALSNIVKLPGGALSMDQEGDQLYVTNDGPYPVLYQAYLYAAYVNDRVFTPSGTLDGQGNWPFLQSDVKGQTANNGYLVIADKSTGSLNEQQWITRLGGNLQYVESWLTRNDVITIQDRSIIPHPTHSYDAFASLVTESGAKFGTTTDTLTGQKDASGNPIVSRTFSIYESAAPTAQSVSVSDGTTLQPGTVTQGDTLKLTLKSNIPLWSGLAAYHYNAVQLTNNATGQSTWAVGSGSSDFQRMQSAQGGHGQQSDVLSYLNTSSLQPGSYTATYWVADGVDRISQSVATTFTVQPSSGPVAGTATVSLSANPIQLPTGQSSTLTASAQGSISSDYIQIVDQSGNSTLGGLNFNNDLRLGESGLTASAIDAQAQTTTYVAELIDSNSLQVVATSAPVSVTWASTTPPPPNGTITLNPSNNQSVTGGTQEAVGYTTTGWQYGDYVQIVPHATNASDTWSNNSDQASTDTFVETEYPQNGQSAKASYTAYLYNSSGQVISVAQSGTVAWTSSAPTILFTASPTSLQTGQASQLSYTVSNLGASDYVTITGTGGHNMWNVTKSTIPGGSYSEVENPSNGAAITVTYTANVYDSSGSVISTAAATITWVSHAPTITMAANPTKMVPGQPSTISYGVQYLQSGDYINVVGTGGAHAWNASTLTSASSSYSEVENPSAGQTMTVNYTATVYSSTGQALNSATVSVAWTNAWTGGVSLSASPLDLAVGNATTLTSTGSTPIPSGYSLYIKDVSTGQIIANTGASPTQTSYTSYGAETDQFVAYVYDGYVTVGTNSNTVSVVWSALFLSASPTALPTSHTSTLTVTGQNVPAGQYLILYDQTIGQVVGFSQSTPYSVTQTKNSPETDNYVAYINSSATPIGAYVTSNTVSVDWYSITLTANPTRLPVSNPSLLVATAQNIPNGYLLMIVDQTTNKVIAQGTAGQTVLAVNESKSVPETDTYVAEVAVPPNPGGTSVVYSGPNFSGFSYLTHSLVEANWNGTKYLIDFWPYLSNGSTLFWSYSADGGVTWQTASKALSTWWALAYSMQGAMWDNTLGAVVGYVGTTNSMGAAGFMMTGPTSMTVYQLPNDATNANGGELTPDSAGGGYLAVEHGGSGSFYGANEQTYNYVQYTGTSMTETATIEGFNRKSGSPYPGSVVSTGPHKFTDIFSLPYGQLQIADLTWNATGTFGPNLNITGLNQMSVSSVEQAISARWIPSLGVVKFYYADIGISNPILYSNTYNPTTNTLGTPIAETTLIGMVQSNTDIAFYMPDDTQLFVVYSSPYVGAPIYRTDNVSGVWSTKTVASLPSGASIAGIASQFDGDTTMAHFAYAAYASGTYTISDYHFMLGSSTSLPSTVAAMSSPVSVTWYNPIIAPDNFNLQALPANVTYPGQTQFKVTFDQSDINFVNQEFGGSAKVVVRAVQTWQPVATGTWTPNTNGSWTAMPYTPVGGTNLQYVAFLVDPKKNVPVAVSNQVTVTDTGHGITGNSYTTTSCSALGNGTEIFNTYTNGTLTKTKTLPLTMQNLEVDGIFNATQQLHTDLGTVIHLPVTNAEVGYGPVPLRVQAPFAFAIQFPAAQLMTVTATFSVNEHDTVDVNGDTAWTVKMHPAVNLPYGFWQGETVMPKLPNGDHISVQITATDDCGSASTPTGVFPYDAFVTTNGRPQWYFVQPVRP